MSQYPLDRATLIRYSLRWTANMLEHEPAVYAPDMMQQLYWSFLPGDEELEEELERAEDEAAEAAGE